MIKNERQYAESVARLREEELRIAEQKEKLVVEGYSDDEVKRLTDPFLSFHLQLKEEVESYERMKRGDFAELRNLVGLGKSLVGLRIASDITQKELAERLGVDVSAVSRDERNEYRGITVDRASRVLDALGVEARMSLNLMRPADDAPQHPTNPSSGDTDLLEG